MQVRSECLCLPKSQKKEATERPFLSKLKSLLNPKSLVACLLKRNNDLDTGFLFLFFFFSSEEVSGVNESIDLA